MKMLFFSADTSEVENVSSEFRQAGIRCEVRTGPNAAGIPPNPSPAELWIHDDRDCHRAFMLCVQLGVGFARRPFRAPTMDMDDALLEEELAQEQEQALERAEAEAALHSHA